MIYKSLLHKYEYVIREMLGADMSPTDLHSLLNMVLNDWIVDGNFTETYLQLAGQAIQLREQAETPVSQVVNLNGEKFALDK